MRYILPLKDIDYFVYPEEDKVLPECESCGATIGGKGICYLCRDMFREVREEI